MAKENAGFAIEKSMIIDAWRMAIADKVMAKDMPAAEKMAEMTSTVVGFVQQLVRDHLQVDRPTSSLCTNKKEEKLRVRATSVAPSADSGFRSSNVSGSSNSTKPGNMTVASKLAASMSRLNTNGALQSAIILCGNWPTLNRSDVHVLRFMNETPAKIQEQLNERCILNVEIKTIICTSNTIWAPGSKALLNGVHSLVEFMHRVSPHARIKFVGFFCKTNEWFKKFNQDVCDHLDSLSYVEFIDLDTVFDAQKIQSMMKVGGMAHLLASMLNEVVSASIQETRPYSSSFENLTSTKLKAALPKPPSVVAMPQEKSGSSKDSLRLYLANGSWPNLEPQDLRFVRFHDQTPAEVIESLRVHHLLRSDLKSVFISPSTGWIRDPTSVACVSEMLTTIRHRCPSAQIRLHGFYTLEIGQKGREYNRKLKEYALQHTRVGYVDFDGLMGSEEFARVSAKMPNPGGQHKIQHTLKVLMQTLVETTR